MSAIQTPEHRGRILVVDDTAGTLYATSRILRSAEFEVVEATTGAAALELVDESIDLVVLDVQLPDIHGFDVCRQLRARPETARTPVVHLSATFRTDMDRAQGLDAGADSYLTHPVEPIVLVASINTLLRARRAEEQQRGSDERFREYFEGSPIGLMIVDGEGLVNEANPAMGEMLKVESSALAARPLASLATEADAESLAAALRPSARGSRRQYFSLQRSDGAVATVDMRLTLLASTATTLVIASDVTEQRAHQAERERLLASERAARDEAERLNRLKDQFIAVLGHELRNPLAAIASGIEILRQGDCDDDRREWLQDSIARHSSGLKHLIDDLLDTTRLLHGKLLLKKRPVAAAEVVQRAIESCCGLIESRHHTISVSVKPKDLMLDADPLRVEQILINLLTNAANYTPEGGKIHVNASQADGFGELVVIDTGVGLAPAELDEIFKAFSQKGKPGEGLGIGLSIVRQLAELHQGTVFAKSEGVGKGASFHVRIPLAVQRDGAGAGAGAEEESVAGVRTLIVDDNRDLALMLQSLLRTRGYAVEVAFSGADALERARTFHPELVLLDIDLPDMSGREVAARLRKNGGGSLIAALSGYGRPPGKLLDFDTYLVKPASLDDIQKLAVQTRSSKTLF